MRTLTVLAALALTGWVAVLAGRARFWQLTPRLPIPPAPATGDAGSWPAIAVVVPARDEAELLPATLPSLLRQDYPGRLTIVLVDDESGDGTGAVARRIAADSPRPVAVVDGRPRPEGWTGKVWALQQGVEAAARSDPALYVFTDADIRHHPGSVRALVTRLRRDHRDLVSVMARLHVGGRWERLLIPAFVYFFALLYPFERVADDRAATAAAAGGCVLVRRSSLEAAGGLRTIRGALIDDVALARAIRRGGGRLWLGVSDEVVSCRRYASLGALWDMVARSADTQLRHSLPLLAGTVAGMSLLFLVPPVAAVVGAAGWLAGGAGAAAAVTGTLATGLLTASGVPVLRLYRLPAWRAALLPVAALLYTAMTLDSAWRHRRGVGGRWKGRTTASTPSGQP